ncbi:MAG: CRISPR-associated protein Cas4 [Candidatus Omnitrophica bacterium]|nr:CRISPR-associated protein Cas4 [Candidatus Omnitrophota bacterium]
MHNEDDLLPISALQHLAFCPRQCALIHIEQAWAENVFTAEGRVMHDKAHDDDAVETRDGVRIERGMSLRSLALGLIGKADVVEFHRPADGKVWTPFPVEYKRGKPKADNCDRVQLCAQALCLEEMLAVDVPAGALFYGKTRRREDVAFDAALRVETSDMTRRLHEFVRAGVTPSAVYDVKCEACSLIALCRPRAMERRLSVEAYLRSSREEP